MPIFGELDEPYASTLPQFPVELGEFSRRVESAVAVIVVVAAPAICRVHESATMVSMTHERGTEGTWVVMSGRGRRPEATEIYGADIIIFLS